MRSQPEPAFRLAMAGDEQEMGDHLGQYCGPLSLGLSDHTPRFDFGLGWVVVGYCCQVQQKISPEQTQENVASAASRIFLRFARVSRIRAI